VNFRFLARRKIPKRYAGLVIGGVMAVIMGLLVSFAMTLINLGLTPGFVGKWMLAFLGALPIQFPIAVMVTPLVVAFVNRHSE
jgi:hypothetical protein